MTEECNTLYNLINIADNFFSEIDSRDLDIAILRWGKGEYTSYEEIGRIYNLTRERIRQILNRTKKKFINRYGTNFNGWKKSFLTRLTMNPEPITIDFMTKYNPKYSSYLYLGLFAEIFDDVPFNNFFPKSFEQLVNRKVERDTRWAKIVELINTFPLNHGEVTPQQLTNILARIGFNLSDQLLCFKIIFGLKNIFFYKEAHKYFLLRRGGIRDITFSILNSSDKPLKFGEIMEIVHKYYYNGSKYDSLNSVISNLKQDERLIQFDRYTFGVEKHFSYPNEKWAIICTVAKQFLSKMSRQCYVTEILENLKVEFPALRSKYELVNILRTDDEIVDLGFFTFIVKDSGIKSRIKLKDAILEIYKRDNRVRHYLEIKNEISNIRHVRAEGLNVILKNINQITKYPCSFYGLKDLDQDNMINLSTHEFFIRSYISTVVYPDTRISNLLDFFNDDENKKKCIRSIRKSNVLSEITVINETESFIISKDWSVIKLIKCVLFNYHKPMYLTELKWILDDLNISNECFLNNKHKIYDDNQIIKRDNMIEYFDYDISSDRDNELIDIFYELLLETKITFSLQDFFSEFKDDIEKEGLDEKKLRAILQEDERFIITSEIIMVRS